MWKTIPTPDVEHWLYIDQRGIPRLARIYEKNGKWWMVVNGSRQRVRYGRWFPLGPVPSIVEAMENECRGGGDK